ncbi:MAG: amidohydrolase, partial [Anaerolineae bacterium]
MAPELALINGKLHTQDLEAPNATAVAVAHRRFVAVGDDSSVGALLGPNTRVLDLGGRRVLPGLTDAHFHLHRWVVSRMRLPLDDTGSLPGLRERLREATTVTPLGQWIVGQGWNETRWPEPRIPTRADLDQAAPDHPVLLWRSDLHLAVANSRALREAGIDRERPDPPHGRIERDASGRPTGVLRELAINVVQDSIPSPPEGRLVDAMRDDIGLLHRLGLTGVHDHRLIGGTDGPLALRAYQRLHSLGGLSVRLWTGIAGEHLDEAIALGLRTGFGDDFLRVGHVKLFADGSQGARTAWMLEPYEDTDDCGMPMTSLEEITEAVTKADEAGLAVAVHAIGDRANRELITVFEKHAGSSVRVAPHRIEHLQIVRPEDVRRLARLGMTASVQPIHLTDDIPLCNTSIGSRCRFAYPFRDTLDTGVTLAFGSDA